MKDIKRSFRNLRTDIVIIGSIILLPIFFISELIYNKVRGY